MDRAKISLLTYNNKNKKYLHNNFHYKSYTIINFVNLNKLEIEIIRQWRNNKEISKWMIDDSLIDSNKHCEFLHKLSNDYHKLYWLIKNNLNQYIGVISLRNIDYRKKTAYLGIYKNPEKDRFLFGKGKLLVDLLLNIVFEKMKFKKLELEVFNDNKRAISLYRKSGFIKMRIKKNYLYRNGVWHDNILMSLVLLCGNPMGY